MRFRRRLLVIFFARFLESLLLRAKPQMWLQFTRVGAGGNSELDYFCALPKRTTAQNITGARKNAAVKTSDLAHNSFDSTRNDNRDSRGAFSTTGR